MRHEFITAGRVIFGAGCLEEAGSITRGYGPRALVVTGRDPSRAGRLMDLLAKAGLRTATVSVDGEPTIELVTRLVADARNVGCDCVIGFGGGSVIDAAKAVAGLLANPGEPLDYLEVIGRGKSLEKPGVPLLAIPTTAGTGAEVTKNAVLGSPGHRLKVSLRSPHLLPQVAIVDPTLTIGVPADITAATGLDALTQLIEPYVSCRASPFTDGFCVEGMKRAARSLVPAFADGSNLGARTDLSMAALLSGLALANSGLGVVHGLASPIGGMFAAPHGAVCAALLPHAMRVNVRALRSRQPDSIALRKYDEIGRILTGRPDAGADDGVEYLGRMLERLRIRRLRDFGITSAHVPQIAESGTKASSTKANPLTLQPEEIAEIVERGL